MRTHEGHHEAVKNRMACLRTFGFGAVAGAGAAAGATARATTFATAPSAFAGVACAGFRGPAGVSPKAAGDDRVRPIINRSSFITLVLRVKQGSEKSDQSNRYNR